MEVKVPESPSRLQKSFACSERSISPYPESQFNKSFCSLMKSLQTPSEASLNSFNSLSPLKSKNKTHISAKVDSGIRKKPRSSSLRTSISTRSSSTCSLKPPSFHGVLRDPSYTQNLAPTKKRVQQSFGKLSSASKKQKFLDHDLSKEIDTLNNLVLTLRDNESLEIWNLCLKVVKNIKEKNFIDDQTADQLQYINNSLNSIKSKKSPFSSSLTNESIHSLQKDLLKAIQNFNLRKISVSFT